MENSRNNTYDQESTINDYNTLDVIIKKYGQNIGYRVFFVKDKMCSDLRDVLNDRGIKFLYVDNTHVTKDENFFKKEGGLYVATIDVMRNYSSILGDFITILIITPSYEEALRRRNIDNRTSKSRYQVDFNNMYERIETIVESRNTDQRLKTLVVHIVDNNQEVESKEEKFERKEKEEQERQKEEQIAEEMSAEIEGV